MATEAECFDCICAASLEHDPDHYARALAELARLTQRSGDAVEQEPAAVAQVRR